MENFEIFNEKCEIETCALYLISLFYKSGCKYTCSRAKINRLLTIYKFCNVKYNPKCFQYHFIVDETYMRISGLNYFIPRNIYLLSKENYFIEDDKQEFTGNFDESVKIPTIYKDSIFKINIGNTSKQILEMIFRNFGSYPLHELAKHLDELKTKIPFRNINLIDSNEFLCFLNSETNNKMYKDNTVFNFIKNFNNMSFNYKTNDCINCKIKNLKKTNNR